MGKRVATVEALETVEDLEHLYDDQKGIAYGLALQMVREKTAAEDVVQDAFLKAWRSRGKYDPSRGGLRNWLLTIVRNQAIDRLRQDRSRSSDELNGETADILADDAADPASIGAERLWIRSALKLLPQLQREAILLAYFGGYTQTQIAARTGQPHGTVKGQLRLALSKLAAMDLARFETIAT